MLHIVLVLLKIIGIILASILGLLLLLILLVLLVPIRYRLNADNQEKIEAEAKISWLLRLIYIRAYYSDSKLVIKLRIFGRIFYDSSNTAEKGKYQKGKTNKNKNSLKKSGVKQQDKKKTKTETKGNLPSKVSTADVTKKEVKTFKRIDEPEIKDSKDMGLLQKKEPDSLDITDPHGNETEFKNPEKLEEKSVIISENQALSEQNKADLTDDLIEDGLGGLYSDTILKAAEIKPGERERKKGFILKIRVFFSKIGGIFSKIKGFFIKIKNFFISLKERLKNIKEKIINLHEKWEKIKVFFSNNKAAFSKSFVTIKRILRHIKPSRLKLDLEFGTGDPSSTGQVLGLLAVFYGYYGKSMQVIPNFEEEILKGSLLCLGRIRLLTLLIICIQLILDKNFRNLLKNFKTLKEDL
jgi:hypothetical protein